MCGEVEVGIGCPCRRCFWGCKGREEEESFGRGRHHRMTLTNRHSVWRFFSFILVSLFSHSLLDSCFLDRSGWSSVGLGVEVLLGTGQVPRQRGALLLPLFWSLACRVLVVGDVILMRAKPKRSMIPLPGCRVQY